MQVSQVSQVSQIKNIKKVVRDKRADQVKQIEPNIHIKKVEQIVRVNPLSQFNPLTQVRQVISDGVSLLHTAVNLQWRHPITRRLTTQYDASTAQSLFMFSYLVMVHNHQEQFITLNPQGFDVVLPLNCSYLCSTVNVAWFFYSSVLNMVVISFTGTYNKILELVDIEYRQSAPTNLYNYIDGMFVHGGFYDLYTRVQQPLLALLNQYVNKETQLVLTGMSLGAATSTLCALDLNGRQLNNSVIIPPPIHYNFAGPRVLNNLAAVKYDKLGLHSFRIVNLSDIIPTAPLPIMITYTGSFNEFRHVGQLIYFDDNLNDYNANHITAYVNYYNVYS